MGWAGLPEVEARPEYGMDRVAALDGRVLCSALAFLYAIMHAYSYNTNAKELQPPCRYGMDVLRSAISLRQLHFLVAVAVASSFSAAAAQTHVAQPALSRPIAMLEAHVGLRLIDRSRKGVTLTEGGVRLYNLARSMLEQLGGVELELRANENKPAGVVTAALPASVAAMLVSQVVREPKSRYPDMILRIVDRLRRDARNLAGLGTPRVVDGLAASSMALSPASGPFTLAEKEARFAN